MNQQRALQVIAESLGELPEKVIPTAELARDLGMDSLDILETVMVLESEIEADVSDETLGGLVTVQDLLNAVGVTS